MEGYDCNWPPRVVESSASVPRLLGGRPTQPTQPTHTCLEHPLQQVQMMILFNEKVTFNQIASVPRSLGGQPDQPSQPTCLPGTESPPLQQQVQMMISLE